MNEDIINKKIEMIEQSRQYMHRMIDEQYDEFIRQSQGISDDETEIDVSQVPDSDPELPF